MKPHEAMTGQSCLNMFCFAPSFHTLETGVHRISTGFNPGSSPRVAHAGDPLFNGKSLADTSLNLVAMIVPLSTATPLCLHMAWVWKWVWGWDRNWGSGWFEGNAFFSEAICWGCPDKIWESFTILRVPCWDVSLRVLVPFLGWL